VNRQSTKLFLSLVAVVSAFSCLAARRDAWLEVRSPNFIIVTNASERQARKTALDFEEIREVFRESLRVAADHPTPVITVIAAKDEDTMKQLLPEDYVKGHAHHAGMFVYRMNMYFAAVRLGQEGANAYETFYHEYYHSLTIPYFPNLPLWVAEGLAEFFAHTEIDDKSVGMGQADPNLLAELQHGPFIPLQVLFKIDRSSPYYNEEKKTSIFYAESWALTHYLMEGDRRAHRSSFISYLNALDQGKSQEEAVAESFGDVKKLEMNLLDYIHSQRFYYMRVPMTSKISEGDLKIRPISEGEADAYRGGFAALRGSSEQAKQLLQQAVAADPQASVTQEYLAISQFFDGEDTAALASVSKAIDADPKNASTRFLRAELVSRGGGLSSANPQLDSDLREAIALNPSLSPPYALLATYLAAQNEKLSDALSFAQKALSLEPANASYQLALAQVLARMEEFDQARIAALRAQAWARQPEEKEQAQAFLGYLEQARQYRPRSAGIAGADRVADSETDRVLDIAQGTVRNGRCQGALTLDLETQGRLLHLRGMASGFPITVENGSIPDFDPCKSLNGLEAEVRYSPDEADEDSGSIRFLRVFAPQGTADLPLGTAVAEGEASSVDCQGHEMRLLLMATGKPVLLHARDYTKIAYVAGANSSLGDLDPCSQLKGRALRITYAITPGKAYAGEIETVVVGK
jgi:Flp pilus assembly protein TadD